MQFMSFMFGLSFALKTKTKKERKKKKSNFIHINVLKNEHLVKTEIEQSLPKIQA